DSSYLDVNVRNVEELVPQLRSNETLVMYIHGFKENVDYAGPKLVSEAYLKYTTENIIAIDYREIANMSYLSAVSLVDTVGATVANALDTIVASVVNATDVHLIGHSLGSQVAGSVARHTNFRVSRIT
ncbi:PREDICTED: pancreatic triacylglycerol lipase-like, partial [Habropoda laboriosa]|uniref:pancreatic triacylglycerol lipase-like n=1 Tax=Habropoda laboriosa TaxID=597456 RepID=UPI00083DA551